MLAHFLAGILSGLFFANSAFCKTDFNSIELQMIIEKLFSKQDTSITKFDGEKYFLNHEKLIFDASGMFLQSDLGEYYPIPKISHNAEGYYLAKIDRYRCTVCEGIHFQCPAICNMYDPKTGEICKNTSFVPIWNCSD